MSTDINEKLALYRSKLADHKNYMDQFNNTTSFKLANEDELKRNQAAEDENHHDFEEEEEEEDAPNTLEELSRVVETGHPMDRVQLATPLQRYESPSEPRHIGGSAERSTNMGKSPSRSPHTSAMYAARRAPPKDESEMYDDILTSQLKAAGRYYTDSPSDVMYLKSQGWLRRRQQILDEARTRLHKERTAECTFHPSIEQKTRQKNIQRAHKRQVVEDAAAAQHKERLEAARRRKQEAEKRAGGPDITKWNGALTIPHEFKLGQPPTEEIPSLRKPRTIRPKYAQYAPVPEEELKQQLELEEEALEREEKKEESQPEEKTEVDALTLIQSLEQKLHQRDEIIQTQNELIKSLEEKVNELYNEHQNKKVNESHEDPTFLHEL